MYQLLIADDEYEIRTGVANYFPWDDLGFTIAGLCENGREVLDFLENHQADVLLCDIRMPIMDGLELAKILSESGSPVKLVFLSGHKDFEYVRKALIYGARDYIVKPTKYTELTETFSKIRRELDARNPVIKEETQNTELLAIRKIKRIIEDTYDTVTLELVSQSVYLNPSYISKLFKQETGKNFFDYVTEVRMKKAAVLLLQPEQKTYEISGLVGYSNPKNFSRAFKKYYDMTPSEYRSRALLEENGL